MTQLVMEYLANSQNLSELVKNQKEIGRPQFLNKETFKSLARQLMTAVDHIHKNGLCHRDIKPDNLVISDDLSIMKLIDFNTAVPFKN